MIFGKSHFISKILDLYATSFWDDIFFSTPGKLSVYL